MADVVFAIDRKMLAIFSLAVILLASSGVASVTSSMYSGTPRATKISADPSSAQRESSSCISSSVYGSLLGFMAHPQEFYYRKKIS